MGKFSRNKGRRGEQQLVIYLSTLYYKAERILNQAHTPGLPDVKATKHGKTYTFENKCYHDRSKTIYTYFNMNSGILPVVGALLSPTVGVAISEDFELLSNASDIKLYPPSSKFEEKVYAKLLKFNEERGSADFLVLKDDRKVRLFLRYWV